MKKCAFFGKIRASGKMTQHTNRFSQQDTIPRAQTAMPARTAQQHGLRGRGGRAGSGWRRRRRIWDAEFNLMGTSCQPCHGGNSRIPVCTTGPHREAWLCWPCRDVRSWKGSRGITCWGAQFCPWARFLLPAPRAVLATSLG